MTCRALDKITWPITEEMIEAINDNFQRLFDDLATGALDVTVAMASALLPVTVANGGTAITSYTAGDLLYASAATTLAKLPVGASAGMFLRSTSTLPAWSTLILPNSATKGDLLYASATNTIGSILDVAVYRVLHSGGVGLAPAWSQVDLATDCTGAIGVTQGGTGQTTVTIGDLLYGSAPNTWAKLAISTTAGMYLRSGGSGAAPSWSAVALPNAATQWCLLCADTSTSVSASRSELAPATANYVLTANGAGTVPSFKAINATNPVLAKAVSYTLLTTDATVITTGTITITLPTAVGASGKLYTMKKSDSAATTLTVNCTGAETIDGAASLTITTQYTALTVVSNNAVWYIV
jgi:hypothetical protein